MARVLSNIIVVYGLLLPTLSAVGVYSYLHTARGILERLLEGDGAVQQADKLRLAARPRKTFRGATMRSRRRERVH